ncbi:UNVERIFIED_ORG: hypothetical protein LHJ69_23615 [Shinella sp. XGS7]|nr:hypothetical protein [Shinella sp. XGS7]
MRTFKPSRHLVVVAAALLGLFPLLARAEYQCRVNVQAVLVYANGTVNVLHTGRGDYTHVCNMDQSRGWASPATCAMWAGLLLQAKRHNTKVDFYFSGDGSCQTLPVYGNSPTPVYIGPAGD